MNQLFKGNVNENEKLFLRNIFTKAEVRQIMLKYFTLNISLRMELLIFYKIVYIDIPLMTNKIDYYTSLLINDAVIHQTNTVFENQNHTKTFGLQLE